MGVGWSLVLLGKYEDPSVRLPLIPDFECGDVAGLVSDFECGGVTGLVSDYGNICLKA